MDGCSMNDSTRTPYWGDAYGIPEGPWETFSGPAPTPAMEWRSNGSAGWPTKWVPVADARTMRNLLEQRGNGRNHYGVELREVARDGQLSMEVTSHAA
jgi:hypothetical protein